MNYTTNDKGQSVIAIGAPGSFERTKIEFPTMIEQLNSLFNSQGNIADAIDLIRKAGILSETQTNNLLAASHFGDSPSPITLLVCNIARSNLRLFADTYRHCLAEAHQDFPQDYFWPKEQLQVVGDKMIAAIERGAYNKDSRAFVATCKYLKIPHTYKAINEFVKS